MILSELDLPDYVKPEVEFVKNNCSSYSDEKDPKRIKYKDLYYIFGINENQYDKGRRRFFQDFLSIVRREDKETN